MLPRNIDLTDSHDFSRIEQRIESSFDLEIDIDRDDLTTPDGHPTLTLVPTSTSRSRELSRIFGRRGHVDESKRIFMDWDSAYDPRDFSGTPICFRCGRRIRIPWHVMYGLCPRCDGATNPKRIPWKEERRTGGPKDDRDVLHLR